MLSVLAKYEDGLVNLKKKIKTNKPLNVIVTFLDDDLEEYKNNDNDSFLGYAEGMVHMSSDFNEPLDDFKEYM